MSAINIGVGVIYGTALILKRWAWMGEHDTLQAVFAILGAWAIIFFPVLVLPQLPPPLNYQVDIVVTTLFVVFSILYFGWKRHWISRKLGQNRTIVWITDALAKLALSVLGVFLIFVAVTSILVFIGSVFYFLIQVMGIVTFTVGALLLSRRIKIRKEPITPDVQTPPAKPPYDPTRFNEAFQAVKQTPSVMRKRWLSELKDILSTLPQGEEWSPELRQQIDDNLLTFVSDHFSDDTEQYLGFIEIVTVKGGETSLEVIKRMFGERIESLYNDPDVDLTVGILKAHQLFNDYSEECLRQVIADALGKWTFDGFDGLNQQIALFELSQKDRGGFLKIRQYLRERINEAELKKDSEVLRRASLLFDKIKGY